MPKHGSDRYSTDEEYRVMILFAWHDSTCPDGTDCITRENHSSQMVSNLPVLKRFLQRLSEIELEASFDAV